MLLESLTDKSPSVCEAVTNSLSKLSEKHPNQVLETCKIFCKKLPTPQNEHIGDVLGIMSRVCSDYLCRIDGDTVLDVIDFSLEMMTKHSTYEPAIQMPASEVLVALGRLHSIQVSSQLLANVINFPTYYSCRLLMH